MDAWLHNHPLHRHLRLHHRSCLLHLRGRDPIDELTRQDSGSVESRIQYRVHHRQHPDAQDAGSHHVELDGQVLFPVGGDLYGMLDLVLFPAAGASGPYVHGS
jgi:hypothetical protein